MKLASYNDGSRDGHLVVVSRDLSTAHYASGIATRMQQLLDDWAFLAPQLQELSISLDHGRARHAFAFEPAKCLAPLPRAHHWAVARAWRSAHAPDTPAPPVQHASGHALLGPCATPTLARAARPGRPEPALDMEAQWLVVSGDVPAGSLPTHALEQVRLLGMGLTWQQRDATEPTHAWPASSLCPVFVTPDELGEAWRAGRLRLPLQLRLNGALLAQLDAGRDMAWHAGQVLAWLARHHGLGAGSLVGLGPVRPAEAALPSAASGNGRNAKTLLKEGRVGAASLAELRALQTQANEPLQPWLQAGDRLSLDMHDALGQSVFGALDTVLAEPGDTVDEVLA